MCSSCYVSTYGTRPQDKWLKLHPVLVNFHFSLVNDFYRKIPNRRHTPSLGFILSA